MTTLRHISILCLTLTAALSVVSGTWGGRAERHRKLERLRGERMSAVLALPEKSHLLHEIDTASVERDTMTVMDDGRELTIMRAVLDSATGEMVATREIRAAVVAARFRNVAERRGKVDLSFEIRVPSGMMDSGWQLRFHPFLMAAGDTVALEDAIVTGEDYRRAQLRGYQQYERFLRRIVEDSTKFVNVRALEIFLRRNIPEVYRFRTDSTYVSDEEFASCFGVTQRMAVEHYTDRFSKSLNERRKQRRSTMYARLVKSPIRTDRVRLDTVIRTSDGDFVYNYIQTINASRGLRKAEITVCGEIFESDRKLYVMPPTPPLVFYISSLSSLADTTARYLVRIISRKVETNAVWNVDFGTGMSAIDERLGDNARTFSDIRRTLSSYLADGVFNLDSVSVAAFASPEGSFSYNRRLSERRAESAVRYFLDLLPQRVRTSASGENWTGLDALVDSDSVLTDKEKASYARTVMRNPDPDRREAALARQPFYRHLKDNLYPMLRTVQFDFFLSRKGMQQDTLHTSEPDSVYMKGVRLLSDREYDAAAEVLAPYWDYNTAVAMLSLERNATAMKILSGLQPDARVNYLLAILHSRSGNYRKAAECYRKACEEDPAYIHRGNLDPEISNLITNK